MADGGREVRNRNEKKGKGKRRKSRKKRGKKMYKYMGNDLSDERQE